MTKLNSNGGDDKVDELLKERYDLAKDRIVEICTETTVKPDFLDFFQNMAAFLEKTAVILDSHHRFIACNTYSSQGGLQEMAG